MKRMNRSSLWIVAVAASLAGAPLWAADTVTEQGASSSPGRAAHDGMKDHASDTGQPVHTGPSDKPGRAAHDGRDHDGSSAGGPVSGGHEADNAPGRADHATKERANQ